jgi:predicted nuclease of restriction endonuclease-like (RecB) superfamily
MKYDDKGMAPSNKSAFEEIATIIDRSRERLFRSVNRELIDMYWEIGRYISEKAKTDKWEKSIVKEFSDFIQAYYDGIKGFSPQNIWRMKQFYETYAENEKLSALLREISWTNNLAIMSRAKTEEALEFYLLLCSKNQYSSRELERQIDSALFERTMISNEQNQLFIERSPGLVALRDSYVLEFLDIPEHHREKELR